jgi:hypothetical protein
MEKKVVINSGIWSIVITLCFVYVGFENNRFNGDDLIPSICLILAIFGILFVLLLHLFSPKQEKPKKPPEPIETKPKQK